MMGPTFILLLCCSGKFILSFRRKALPIAIGMCILYIVRKEWKVWKSMEAIMKVVVLILLVSCNAETIKKEDPKIAKTVPLNYRLDNDSNFFNHQDTVYYGKQFFTGFRYALYATGDTAFIKSYFNGVEEGPQKKWYDNKKLAEQRFYINGKKEGLQQGWWPDASPKFMYTSNSDVYEGELKEWNFAGLLYKHFHYVNGQEEGSQKLLWDNGTIRANYVVRNGKKYGLIGLKLCNNPYDSITKK
jgi:antitoxin component YwqK of YwqJK toxin-antitoxin module